MKKNQYWLPLAWVALAGLTSCDPNLLNTVPNDRLSEEVFWKTESDAELAVNSLYNDLDGTSIFARDAYTDIAHVNTNFNVAAFIELGTYDATNSQVYTEWKNAYTGIRAANNFLSNIGRITVSNEEKVNRLIGEARVLRAYQYIKLVGLYGDVPLVTAPISIEEGRNLTRTPTAQIWDFVSKELDEAALLLPVSYNDANKGRITKGAALGLKARANLLAGRYEIAAAAAQQVIESGNYQLYPSYQNLFTYAAENNAEVILDKQSIKDQTPFNTVFNLLAPYSQKTSQSSFVPTKAVVDLYEMTNGKAISDAASGYKENAPYENRDPRLHFSIFLDGDVLPSGIVFRPAPNSGTADAVGSTYIASTTGFNIKKYINPSDYEKPDNSGINIILLRYAEVLLTYAEAKIELNQVDASVINAINLVRNGRSDVKQPAIASSLPQTSLREIVRKERTIELAFEGLHLYDIRRWKTAEKLLTGPVYGITYLVNGQPTVVQVVAINRYFDPSRHYLWPVPQKERDLNPHLTQNPNW